MTEIVKTSAPRLTPSAVGDLRCPAKYKLLRIDRIWEKREVILAVSHGKAVHLVLHDIYGSRIGGVLDTSNIEALARGAVRTTLYPRDMDRETQVQRVIAATRGFVAADDEDDIEGIRDLERQGQFEVRMDGRVLCLMSAKLDSVLVRPSEPNVLVIRERKTTAQRIDLKEAYIQMRIAQKMHPEFDLKQVQIEYDWLDDDNRVIRDTVAARELRGQHQIVLGLAYRVLTASEYPTIPGEACTFCPKRDACQTLPADDYAEAQLRQMADDLDELSGV